MRTLPGAALAMLLLTACASSAPARPTQAPDFTLAGDDGGAKKGSSLWKDRSVLLVFMTSW